MTTATAAAITQTWWPQFSLAACACILYMFKYGIQTILRKVSGMLWITFFAHSALPLLLPLPLLFTGLLLINGNYFIFIIYFLGTLNCFSIHFVLSLFISGFAFYSWAHIHSWYGTRAPYFCVFEMLLLVFAFLLQNFTAVQLVNGMAHMCVYIICTPFQGVWISFISGNISVWICRHINACAGTRIGARILLQLI